MIDVQGLTRFYGPVAALRDVSFRIATGEVVGFLGPNGAGKSTTMKILTGSLAPSAGTVRIAGHDLMKEPLAVRRRIGFMPEQVVLYSDQTVAELLDFVATMKEVPKAGRRDHLVRIIEQTGLQEVTGKLVGSLSHGFRKRAGLAQALVGDPQVLILDEPTSGLDPHQIVEIRELIRRFRGERTVMLSSHVLSEVEATCGRVLILDKGRLVGEQGASGLTQADPAGMTDGQQRIVLTWDGNRDEVAAALALVMGVDDIVLTDTGAEVLIAGNPVEIRPRLVESVVNAGGLLQGIQAKGPSLEDLFLHLTGADGAAGLSAPAPDDPEEP